MSSAVNSTSPHIPVSQPSSSSSKCVTAAKVTLVVLGILAIGGGTALAIMHPYSAASICLLVFGTLSFVVGAALTSASSKSKNLNSRPEVPRTVTRTKRRVVRLRVPAGDNVDRSSGVQSSRTEEQRRIGNEQQAAEVERQNAAEAHEGYEQDLGECERIENPRKALDLLRQLSRKYSIYKYKILKDSPLAQRVERLKMSCFENIYQAERSRGRIGAARLPFEHEMLQFLREKKGHTEAKSESDITDDGAFLSYIVIGRV